MVKMMICLTCYVISLLNVVIQWKFEQKSVRSSEDFRFSCGATLTASTCKCNVVALVCIKAGVDTVLHVFSKSNFQETF